MNTRIHIQEAFKFALSITLMYWLVLWMNWDLTAYGVLAITVISLSTSGASINKGVMRVIGTIIACIVALILIAWFAQARWGMMFALAGYLTFVSYFLQTSRYPYAWYVAGIVTVVIWANTYGAIDNTFHFAIFRLLETSAGVLIYTLVSIFLWPQTADKQFYRQGAETLDCLCQQIQLYRATLRGEKGNDASVVRRKLGTLSSQLQATMREAISDSSLIHEQKQEWLHALAMLRSLTDHLALWPVINKAYQHPELNQARLDLEHALQVVERRCVRIGELWRTAQLLGAASVTDDLALMQVLQTKLTVPDIAHNAERGLLLNQAKLLRGIDQASLQLLITLRGLVELDSSVIQTDQLESVIFDQAPRWDLERLLKSLVPALALIFGFLFWVFPSSPPPGGNSLIMFCVIFALLVPMGTSFRNLALAHTLGGLAIAPLYFIIMPWLDGGAGLLTMIFLMSFVFGYLGERWPLTKLGGMIVFAMAADVSNTQTYSFMKWLNSEFVYIMALIIVTLVVMFMTPIHPEKILLRRISHFFHACTVVSKGFTKRATAEIKKSERNLCKVRILPRELFAVEQTLNYKLFPANTQSKIRYLLDSVQDLAFRMQVLDTLMKQVTTNGPIVPLGTELPQQLQQIFQSWVKTTTATGVSEAEWGKIETLYSELEQRLEAYYTESEKPFYNEQMAIDLTALLYGVRSLLDEMVEIDRAIHDINWLQWQ